jgi:hypothetical protein
MVKAKFGERAVPVKVRKISREASPSKKMDDGTRCTRTARGGIELSAGRKLKKLHPGVDDPWIVIAWSVEAVEAFISAAQRAAQANLAPRRPPYLGQGPLKANAFKGAVVAFAATLSTGAVMGTFCDAAIAPMTQLEPSPASSNATVAGAFSISARLPVSDQSSRRPPTGRRTRRYTQVVSKFSGILTDPWFVAVFRHAGNLQPLAALGFVNERRAVGLPVRVALELPAHGVPVFN